MGTFADAAPLSSQSRSALPSGVICRPELSRTAALSSWRNAVRVKRAADEREAILRTASIPGWELWYSSRMGETFRWNCSRFAVQGKPQYGHPALL